METSKNNFAKYTLIALSIVLFVLCVWGPFYYEAKIINEDGSIGKNYSFTEFVEKHNKMAIAINQPDEKIPGIVSFIMYGLPLICLVMSAIAAFKPSFWPRLVAWICRIAAIIIGFWLLHMALGGLSAWLYLDALIAAVIAIVAGSFVFQRRVKA